MKNIRSIFALSLFVLFLSGCSATGSSFTGARSAPSDQGAIVFYRPKAFSGGGVTVNLKDNGTTIGSLKNGQFIQKIVSPGPHKFHTDTAAIDRILNLNIEAGQTYYIRTGLRMGMWVGSWHLTRIFPQEAIAELNKCCKSGS